MLIYLMVIFDLSELLILMVWWDLVVDPCRVRHIAAEVVSTDWLPSTKMMADLTLTIAMMKVTALVSRVCDFLLAWVIKLA